MRAREQVEAICISKARNASLEQREYEGPGRPHFDAIIVSDTMIEDPDEPRLSMGKPTDFLGAAGMLIRLSGRRHVVWSSTTILLPLGSNGGGRIFEEGWRASTFTTSSTVEFVELEEEEISHLVSSESWRGKAGGYDLAGAAGEYCHLVEGEEVTVLGLSSQAVQHLTNVLSR
jgi:predicted house-cleaning NTP pyrophosphatase (Maf/HAM1 superfamily)